MIWICIMMNDLYISMELLTSSSSSDEDELINIIQRKKEKRVKVKNYIEVVRNMSDKTFKSNFRMSRETCYQVIEKFERSPFYPSDRSHGGTPISSAEKHVLLFLWFAGNKCSLRQVGDRFNLSVSTCESVLQRVMDYLYDISKEIITFPLTSEEKYAAARNFKKIAGFDGVIGCIEGTYINIRTPAHKLRRTYANRHHTTSIVLQAVCNDNKKFIDVFTGIPGKVHDSRTFKLSFLSQEIDEICENGRFHLLGDSAYPVRKFLMTPYKDYGNLTPSQNLFNSTLSATRVKIENAFGLLKSRFRQLMLLAFHKVFKMSLFIIACCVLHNICIDSNDLLLCDDALNEAHFNESVELEDNETVLRQEGENKRNEICNRMSARL